MVYAAPLMTPTTDLGLSIRLFMSDLSEAGDLDIILGLLEQAWSWPVGLKTKGFPGFAIVNEKCDFSR